MPGGITLRVAMADAVDSDMIVDDEGVLQIEANEVVKEIAYAVNFVQISTVLPKETHLVYINITTKENQNLCVELSIQGFRIVGYQYNEINPQHFSRFYETIYGLLDRHSGEYRNTFCETLTNKLLNLQQRHSTEEDTSDDQMDTK